MFLITQNVKYRMIDEMNCAVVSKKFPILYLFIVIKYTKK